MFNSFSFFKQVQLKIFLGLKHSQKERPIICPQSISITYFIHKITFNNYIPSEQLAVPGSTKYNNDKPNKTNAPRYTLRQKTSVVDKKMTIDPQNKNPGPGSYLNP